jgi:hypothetical protein
MRKEAYVRPVVVKHELLRDITAGGSVTGNTKGNCGFGNGAPDGIPGGSGCQDVTR